MSTKMYHLYRYDGDIFALHQWLLNARKIYIKFVQEDLRKFDKDGSHKIQIRELIMQHTRQGLRSMFNIEASAVVYLLASGLHVQFFGLSERILWAITEGIPLIDCSYQNQSDKPEEVDDDEWERRSLLCEEIFKISDVPSRAGLSFVFADINDAWSII